MSEQPEPVEAYLARYLTAIRDGVEPPALDDLAEGTRAEVSELLELVSASRVDEEDRAENDDGIDLRPLEESSFAVDHGLTSSAPDVVIAGPTVRRARESAGLTPSDVAGELTRRGHTTGAETIAEVEAHPAYRMRPRHGRLYAAILDLPLAAIEATAEPWPAGPESLVPLREAGADAVMLGDDVVVRTGAGSYLGVVRCEGEADVLGSRTYRLVAATLLNGPWSHLAGALLVTQASPHLALPVDALDCVTRSHAPTGLSGFSRLADPAPLAEVVAAYDRTFSIGWSDPDPLVEAGTEPGPALVASAAAMADRLADLADELSHEARRARQPGKRRGYETAASWVRNSEPHEIAALLDDLAVTPPDAAVERLSEVLPT